MRSPSLSTAGQGAHPSWPGNPLIYQLYIRSFQDSDGDGIGDLQGVIDRVDHIAALKPDILYLSPVSSSPWVDGGYDPTSHTDIHSTLGDEDTFRALSEAVHTRGMRLMIDLVLNHTSDQHPWFKAAIAGDPDYDTHYVWCDGGDDGSLPNNWMSRFGPPAWTWNHKREQYYLHNYLPQQPKLNHRCPAVQAETKRILRTWRDRGVDAFRFDAVTMLLCDPKYRSNPPARPKVRKKVDGESFLPYTRQDHKYDLLPGDGATMTEDLRTYAGDDAYLMGEVTTGNKSVEIAMEITQKGRLNAAYTTDIAEGGLTAENFADLLSRADGLHRFPIWAQSHDQARKLDGPTGAMSRFVNALLLLFPAPVIYYMGTELGLPQPELHEDEITDPYDAKYWPDGPGRENARVPLPWSEAGMFGFTEGEPWLPMRWDAGLSVEAQSGRPESTLGFARRLAEARQQLGIGQASLKSFERMGDILRLDLDGAAQPCAVLINFAEEPVHYDHDPSARLVGTHDGQGKTLAALSVMVIGT